MNNPNERVWRWRQYAIMAGAPLIGGLLAWQLYTLSPKEWCQTAYDFAKTDNIQGVLDALKTCVGLQVNILKIKDHAIIGLMAILGLGYVMLMARELGIRAKGTGPGGMGFDIGSDGGTKAAQAADHVVEGAERAAAEVKTGD